MYELKTSAAFDSAHFLSGYQGKCSNLHGHRWTIEASVSAQALQQEGQCRGMILDFGIVKQALRELADSLDHAFIYEEGTLQKATIEALMAEGFRLIPVPFRPTAECFAKYFFDTLTAQELPISSITVYETPTNCATYRETQQ